LPPYIAKSVEDFDLVVASVLSGNRNFEARIHPQVRMNFLMSPMLVVAYALAGRVDVDLIHDPISYDPNQQPVYLKDIWPTDEEIMELMNKVLSPKDFAKNYGEIFDGNEIWRNLDVPDEKLYAWDKDSTYIKEAPFFYNISDTPRPMQNIKPKDCDQHRVRRVVPAPVTRGHAQLLPIRRKHRGIEWSADCR